jgi:hypothetical protein
MHHAMEMNALFFFDSKRLEEQIHQKCFAAADATPDIKSLHGIIVCSGAAAEQLRNATMGPCRLQLLLQVGEQRDDLRLRRVLFVAIGVEACLVGLANTRNSGYPFSCTAKTLTRTQFYL